MIRYKVIDEISNKSVEFYNPTDAEFYAFFLVFDTFVKGVDACYECKKDMIITWRIFNG